MLKGQKGITLVALVITIIVLIILAGVSIALVLDENGILGRAKQAKEDYAHGANVQHDQMANADEWIEDYLGGTSTDGDGE